MDELDIRVEKLNGLFKEARSKKDYDTILNTFDIKIIKNNKVATPLYQTMLVKKRIIQMAIHEPTDIFNLDIYKKVKAQCKL